MTFRERPDKRTPPPPGAIEPVYAEVGARIRWLRQQLEEKPRSLQDLTPEFTKQLQAWERHEVTIELRDILADSWRQAAPPGLIDAYPELGTPYAD